MNDKHTSFTVDNDDLEPQLESAVGAVLSEPLPADAIARVKSRALTLANEPSPDVRSSSLAPSWYRPWMQIASLAACILLVFGAPLMMPSSSSAFSQAIERLKETGAFRYKELVYLTTQEMPVEIEVLVSEDGRERKSMQGTVSVHDSTGQIRLTLNEVSKSAILHVPMAGIPDEPERQFNWFERLKSSGTKPDKELGTMKIDGRDCLGFEVKPTPSVVYAVWVDAHTNELVQVEFRGMPKGSSVTKSLIKNFEFNVSFDPTLFSFDAPQGYDSTTAEKLPELLPFEESLVEAIKGYTELSGGRFPISLTDSAEWMTMLSKDGVPRTILAARLGTLTPYLVGMSYDDYEYTGAGQEVGNERAIVFWYRNPEKQLRAVFNDFTVSSISEADLSDK